MSHTKHVLLPAVAAVLLNSAPAAAELPGVQLTLITESGFPLTGTQEWLTALKPLKLSGLRIRGPQTGDKLDIEQRGPSSAPIYFVNGFLTTKNTLRLPGATFRRNEIGKLKIWIEELKKEGPPGSREARGAFGLAESDLLRTHEALAKKVKLSTKGKTPKQVVRDIARQVRPGVVIAPATRRRFDDADPVADELRGVSCGTALAAVLRPLGLAFVPVQTTDKSIDLAVFDARDTDEIWPIGWPREKKVIKVAPKLFETLEVEISDIPLSEALEAIGERLEIPLLLDHNTLVRHRIDPAKVAVSLPLKRTFYKNILDRILYQAKLKLEVRVDEADRPVIWISTIKR